MTDERKEQIMQQAKWLAGRKEIDIQDEKVTILDVCGETKAMILKSGNLYLNGVFSNPDLRRINKIVSLLRK